MAAAVPAVAFAAVIHIAPAADADDAAPTVITGTHDVGELGELIGSSTEVVFSHAFRLSAR